MKKERWCIEDEPQKSFKTTKEKMKCCFQFQTISDIELMELSIRKCWLAQLKKENKLFL